MKQEFDEYLSKKPDVTSYHAEQAFADGFKVDAQMMLEILETDTGFYASSNDCK